MDPAVPPPAVLSTSVPNTALCWRKSSHSQGDGGDCVELAPLTGGAFAIRDSKDPDGPRLAVHAAAVHSVITAIKAGHHDL